VFVAESGRKFVYYDSERPENSGQLFFSPGSSEFYELMPEYSIGDTHEHALFFSNRLRRLTLNENYLECSIDTITYNSETYRLDYTLFFDRSNQRILRGVNEMPVRIIAIKRDRRRW
jgi:hypothetical protein